jgi:hypothetical protein
LTDDPDGVTGRSAGLPAVATPDGDRLPPETGTDLTGIARQILASAVPGLADGASVFVLEHLLKDGASVGRPAGDQLMVRRLGTRVSRARHRIPAGALPPGEVIAFARDSAHGRCVAEGRLVRFSLPDGTVLEPIGPRGRELLAGFTSCLAVPMMARDSVAGFVSLARGPGLPAFSSHDAEAATALAARGGASIVNALALIRQRSVSEALQRGLLAARPAVPAGLQVAGLDVAGRCLPADGCAIGSDWLDIIALPGGRTGVIVGDVMGHGPESTAVMAELRVTARVLAGLDLPPAEMLRRLDRPASSLPRVTLATCAYAVIDPGAGACTLAGAGHLPPVLALPDGTTRVPDVPAGPSLGIGPSAYGQAWIKLPPGTVLALYTDGLVETRTRSYEQGIAGLRSVLGREHHNLETACDALLEALAARREDDVTMVLARVPPDRPLRCG